MLRENSELTNNKKEIDPFGQGINIDIEKAKSSSELRIVVRLPEFEPNENHFLES